MIYGVISRDTIWAVAVLGSFLLGALVIHLLWTRLLRRYLHAADTVNVAISKSVRRLVTFGILLLGVYCATTSLAGAKQYPRLIENLGKCLGIGWTLLAISTILSALHSWLQWYVKDVALRDGNAQDVSYRANLANKLLSTLVVVLGGLYILRIAGLDIGPLLASGAIGGLAVALALQDTLNNLFAGLYLTIDHPARVGDYIMLETGQEGNVAAIGWRHTQVKVPGNNVVIIPNAKLSQAIITNFSLPVPNMVVSIACAVGYDSDLDHVETVTIDVAEAIQKSADGADPDWKPVIIWKEFADSAVTFATVLGVKEFKAQHAVQSAFMKALHRRYQSEGIRVPYPMRTVQLEQSARLSDCVVSMQPPVDAE